MKNKNKKTKKGTKITKKALANIDILFNERNEATKFMEDNSSTILEAIDGEGIQILVPKQMLQRLPVVLAPAKADNKSENLLKEIRQIVSSLY